MRGWWSQVHDRLWLHKRYLVSQGPDSSTAQFPLLPHQLSKEGKSHKRTKQTKPPVMRALPPLAEKYFLTMNSSLTSTLILIRTFTFYLMVGDPAEAKVRSSPPTQIRSLLGWQTVTVGQRKMQLPTKQREPNQMPLSPGLRASCSKLKSCFLTIITS